MATQSQNPTVLLVDDDPAVLSALELALTERGAAVTAAGDLDAACSALKRRRYAMVMTDLCLESAREGLEVARLARSRMPDAKVVVFSGADIQPIEDRAAKMGVDEILPKPLTGSILDRLLADLGVEEPEIPAPGNRRSKRLSDTEGQAILIQFTQGDQHALDTLIEAYSPMLFSVFLRWFRLTTEDAEDLFQEVLLQLVIKADTIRNIRMWLLGTAINQSKKRIRRLIRDRRLAELYLARHDIEDTPFDDEDVRDLISRGLSSLRASDRELLAMLYIEGLSYQEAAQRLDRPIGSIGPLRGRALQRLTRIVADLETPPTPSVN